MAKKTNAKGDYVNEKTGEVFEGKLNQIITTYTKRPNGSLRIQKSFEYCPTLAEQHTAHLSDINYLMERYKPDELASYIAARNEHRRVIEGHDFSREPSLQDAKNTIYNSKKAFMDLPDEVRSNFSSHLEFLKFIDNPANKEKMLRLGLLSEEEIKKIQVPVPNPVTPPTPTPTNHEEKETAKG